MTNQPDQNRQFLTTLANLGIATHRLDRIRDAARLHRQQLLGTSELYAVIEADDEPEQCPRSEFDGYGLQCQKPAGHNLCTFEEPPAAVSAAVAPPTTHTDPELTAEEARTLADELGLQLYRAQDALAFVAECCDIADREQRTVTTADVREWLTGARCGRQLAADATGRGDCPDLDAIAARAADAQQYGIEDDGFEQLVREDVPALITALRRMADETATETPAAEPTAEDIARAHVTSLHLIGEQLATIESWFWEHLADVRDAGARQDQTATETPHTCKPGASTYYCPTSGQTESDCHGGFTTCCDRPDLHQPAAGARQDGAEEMATDGCTPACDHTPGIRGLLEHVGIDTTGRDISVGDTVVDAWTDQPAAGARQDGAQQP